jgi:hypothetical protein
MNTFLMIVGGFLMAFALFALIVYFWIRAKIRGFAAKFGEAIQQMAAAAAVGHPPMRVELEPAEELEWDDAEAVEALAGPLLVSGFVEAGRYQCMMNTFVKMRAFAHVDHCIYAVVYEAQPIGTWMDLVATHTDGTSLTYSTAKSPGMKRPPGKPAEYLPDLGAQALLDRFLANRPDKESLPTPPEEFAATFERAYAEEMDWLAGRGGPDEEEIRAIAARDGTEVDEETIQAVQQSWQSHFRQYWDERLREGFLVTSGVSAAEWEQIRDRVVFVHDRLSIEDLVEHFDSAVYQEYEEADEAGDEGEKDEEEGEKDEGEEDEAAKRRLEELREIARGCPPREAFAQINELVPEGLRFARYGQVSDPIEADVWLEPEGEYDD